MEEKNLQRALLAFKFGVFIAPISLSFAQGKNVEGFLSEVRQKSHQFKITEYKNKSNLSLKEKEALVFKTQGFLYGNYLKEDTPEASQFARSGSTMYEYGIGAEKLWRSGINSKISYTLSDVSNTFYSADSNEFLSPKLELSLSSNIVQDFFYNRYQHLSAEVENGVEEIKASERLSKKNILTVSLLSFSTLLEQREELLIQKRLCNKIRVQMEKLSEKRKRKSISRRDYLLSLKESVLCEATIEEINKELVESQKDFKSSYNVDFKQFSSLSSFQLFKELEKKYLTLKQKQKKAVDLSQKSEIAYLNKALKAARSSQDKFNAATKSDLSLEVKAGATGLDDSFDRSHEDVSELNYPFIFIGLKTSLPWSSYEAKATAAANRYKIKAIEEEKKLVEVQSLNRFETLNQTLKIDFLVYKKYLKSLELSSKVLDEARKDFSNGRIDFYSLTEFNKILLQDQKTLSSYRLKLIARIVEYLDHYNYFNQFL